MVTGERRGVKGEAASALRNVNDRSCCAITMRYGNTHYFCKGIVYK